MKKIPLKKIYSLAFFQLSLLVSIYENKLTVISPQSLKDKLISNVVDESVAYFGYIPWGKTLIGNVLYADPHQACSPISPFVLTNASIGSPIVLVDRGNCSYVTKAYYAQILGAKMVIIADNQYEDTTHAVVNDNGEGSAIVIPVIMIDKEDGSKMKETALDPTANESIVVSILFEMKKDQKDRLDYWISTSDLHSYKFLKEFESSYIKLKSHIEFNPRYAVWLCTSCKYHNFRVKNNDNCLSGGRYCYPDPDGTDQPLTGDIYVKESIRQICVLQLSLIKWWDYIKLYESTCINRYDMDNCTDNILDRISLNKSIIKKCLNDSFGGGDMKEKDNSILKLERERFIESGVQILPSIIINNVTFKGNFDPDLVFEAVCDGFIKPPSVCQVFEEENDEVAIVNKENEKQEMSQIKLLIIIVVCTIVVPILFVVFYCIFRKHYRTELPADLTFRIESAVSNYFAFQDRDTSEKSKIIPVEVELNS